MNSRCSTSIVKGLCTFAICTMAAMTAMAGEDIRILGVDGSFDSGALILIQGQDFGQKEPAFPIVWDDFEHGAVGAPVGQPVIGNYDRVSSQIVYTDSGVYSGSRSAYEYFDGSVWENGVVSNWIPEEATDSFASMKVKFTGSNGNLVEPSSKLLRLNTWDPDATHGYPNFVVGLRGHSASLEIITNIGAGWGDPGSETVGSVGSAQFDDPNGEWFGVSIWVHMGDVGVANGFAGREFNGDVVERHNIMTLLDTDGFHDFQGIRSAYFNGHMGLYESSSLEAVIDEVYADNTFARVVATGPDGGQFAMQIPHSWSDSSIQIRVNTGSYENGTPLTLVVYDSDNNPSPPFNVTVGEASGGGDQGIPGPPSVVVLNSE